ncbi:MAG: hypothetical protein IKP92_08655 [Lachnospiraceae bacterium]|nr:hypothetical protein [Lachnospiraceae bacterium]
MNFKKNYFHSFIWALFCVLLFTGIGVSAIGYSEIKGETAYLLYVGLYYAIFLVAIALIMLLYKYLKKPLSGVIDLKKFKLEGIPEMIGIFVVAIFAIIARFANVIALFLKKETMGIVKGTEAYFDYANGLLDSLGSSENGAYIYASILRGAISVFGDNIVVVYVLQSLFAVGAMVLLYFALRKIVPGFIPWLAYLLAAFLPGSMQLFLYCTPGLFYAFMLSAYFFGIVYLIDAFRKGKLIDKAVYALYAIAGVSAGFLAFFDISGLILIPLTVYAFFVFKKDADIKDGKEEEKTDTAPAELKKHEKPLTQALIFGLTAVAVLLFSLFTFSQGISFGISGIVRYAMLFVPRDGINVTILTPHFGYPDAIALYVFAGLWLLAYLRTKKDRVFVFVLYVVVITLIHFLTMDHVDYGALISLLFIAIAPFGIASLGTLVAAADAPAVPAVPFVPELSKGETILSENAVTESSAKPAVQKSAETTESEEKKKEEDTIKAAEPIVAVAEKSNTQAQDVAAKETETDAGQKENTDHLNTENENTKEEKKPDLRKLDKEAKRAARMRKKGIIVLGDNPVVTEAVEEVEKQAEEEASRKRAAAEEKKAKKAAEKEAKKAAKEAAKQEKEAKKAEEAARKAEEAAKKKAEEEAKKAEEEARKAEEAARKAEEEAKKATEEEAARKAAEEEAARKAAEEEAVRKAAEEEAARKAAEEEAARKAAEEEAARKAAEEEAARKAAEEEAARKAAEEEAARKAAEEEAARKAAEEEAARKAAEEEAAGKAVEEVQKDAATEETPAAAEESKEGYSKYTNKKLEPYVPQKLIRSRGRMFNPVSKTDAEPVLAPAPSATEIVPAPPVSVSSVIATAADEGTKKTEEKRTSSEETAKKAEEIKTAANEATKKSEEANKASEEVSGKTAEEANRKPVEERKRTDYIKNPLPGPRPHVSRELVFDYDPSDDEMDFDLKDLDGKDFYDI